MAKQRNHLSSKGNSKQNITTKINNPKGGRPYVMTPKAGVTRTRRRLEYGGKRAS